MEKYNRKGLVGKIQQKKSGLEKLKKERVCWKNTAEKGGMEKYNRKDWENTTEKGQYGKIQQRKDGLEKNN